MFPGNIERRLQPGRIESGMPSGIVNRLKELQKLAICIFNVKVTKLNVEFSVVLTTGLTVQ